MVVSTSSRLDSHGFAKTSVNWRRVVGIVAICETSRGPSSAVVYEGRPGRVKWNRFLGSPLVMIAPLRVRMSRASSVRWA